MAKRSRSHSDESYVIDLCDQTLELTSLRQHRFDFLRGDGDPGRKLPVDAYYASMSLVIEYRERQHTEPVPLWDRKPTVSGMPRGQQRARYDQRRRDVLPDHGITLLEISYDQLAHGRGRRLIRDVESDTRVLRKLLLPLLRQHRSAASR